MKDLLFFLAAISISLYGINLISRSFGDIVRGTLNSKIVNSLSSPTRTALYGYVFTALTGDIPSLFALLGSLITSGLVSEGIAYTTLLWGTLGQVVPLYLTVINFQIVVYCMLIISVFSLFLIKVEKWQPIILVSLGVSLILFGLQLTKGSGNPLDTMPKLQEFLENSKNSYFAPIMFGLTVRFLGNSLMLISIVGALSMKSGMMNYQQFVLYICGSSLEVVLTTSLIYLFLKNYYKRLCTTSIFLNAILIASFVLLIYFERILDKPILTQYISHLGKSEEMQTINFIMIYSIFGFIIMRLCKPFVLLFWNKFIKITYKIKNDEPMFINLDLIDNDELAFEKIEKEQIRLAEQILDYFTNLKNDDKDSEDNVMRINRDFLALDNICYNYMRQLLHHISKNESFEVLFHFLNRQQGLTELNTLIYQFSMEILCYKTDDHLTRQKTLSFIEVLELMLFQLIDLMKSPSKQTYDEYFNFIRNKTEVYEQIRMQYLIEEIDISRLNKLHILDISLLIEKIEFVIVQLADKIASPLTFQKRQLQERSRWASILGGTNSIVS